MMYGNSSFAGLRRVRAWAGFTVGIITVGLVQAGGQALPYFSSASGLGGAALKAELQSIISTGTVSLTYTPQVWDAHKDLYEDPDNPSNLILFYSQASWPKSAQDPGSGSTEYWNREHLWANSFGIDGDRPAYTDLFHLVPANKYVNNDRSNNYFDYADPAKPNYEDPANAISTGCKENGGIIWEPADGQKGWVARALLYMDTRYIELELVDIEYPQDLSTSESKIAQLSVMLEWNRRFPVSAKEAYINQRVYDDYQHNRNPFIDFPEFADSIWVSGPSWGAWRLEHFSLEELLDPAISGDLADPDGDQLNNLVEMALYSDPRVADAQPPLGIALLDSELLITFDRSDSLENLNLDLLLESSGDLQTWDSVPLDGAILTPAGTDQETVSLTIPISSETTLFYRLRVVRL